MRIIAGKRARAGLVGPRDRTTRPIPDRVKEALFSILNPVIAGSLVADLFCGTGSMGLEAVSRGCQHAVMADRDSDAIKKLNQNIAKLRFESQTTVRQTDIFRIGIPSFNLTPASPSDPNSNKCNLVFLDPPYIMSRDCSLESPLGRLIVKISTQIAPNARLVLRHERRSCPLDVYQDLHQTDQRTYGGMTLTFFENSL